LARESHHAQVRQRFSTCALAIYLRLAAGDRAVAYRQEGSSMRRKDREIMDPLELRDVLEKADVCRIALSSKEGPYIVPLNFGFEWDGALVLYFHGANVGRKLDLMRRNGRVGFEVDVDHLILRDGSACEWGMRYRSIIGTGWLSQVADEDGKRRAVDAIMRHYGFQGQPTYHELTFSSTAVLRLDVEKMSGKKNALSFATDAATGRDAGARDP
ncbi:MAG TPA: pyridoxamine 5'-phosphate oxidase family protein, partial [Anaeromyxobacteraceae bacterium]|nr:pyridoxamine 5'-phosphate oxidase family protein [Anaeromyxobacteraceae bacterium]